MEIVETADEILARVELDLARSSEKLVNLDMLALHIAAREEDFEAFGIIREWASNHCVQKALEFDLLLGFFDSEVRELDSFLSTLDMEIHRFNQITSSKKMGENLEDCQKFLKQLESQSANFQRILLMENYESRNTRINMETKEQQRQVLRMLERSLGREIELEKKLTESRGSEKELKFKLQRHVCWTMEESEVTCERLFEAEYTAEVLSGISRELLRRIESVEFDLEGSTEREGELRCRLQKSESTIKDMEDLITELKSKVSNSKPANQPERAKAKSTVEHNPKLRRSKISKG